MAKFDLHRLFTDPATLRSIAPEHLWSLLARHAEALASGGLVLPAGAGEPLDYETLARLLMAPEKLPEALREAFFFVHEMATPAGMECLLEAAEQACLPIAGLPAPSPADVAVQVWLADPDLLERKHAEQFIRRLRGLESYHATVWPLPACRPLTPELIKAMTSDLNDWFEKRRKGRSAKVFHYPRPDGIWFMVRHGDPFKREGAIDERGESVGSTTGPNGLTRWCLTRKTGNWASARPTRARRENTARSSAATCTATRSSSAARTNTLWSRCASRGPTAWHRSKGWMRCS